MGANITDDRVKLTAEQHDLPVTALIALNKKILTKEQLEKTLDYCESERRAGREKSFEDALLEKNYMTDDVMMKLIAVTIRNMNISLGEIAVESGLVSQTHIDNALRIQAEKFKKGELILIGDLLINAGLLTKEKRDELLEIIEPEKLLAGKSENFKKTAVYQTEITMGELAVTYSFVTVNELAIGLKYLKKAYKQGLKVSLERILLEKGFLAEEQASLLNEIKKFLITRDLDMQFAVIAVEEDCLTRSISRAMLARQLEEFGEKKQCITLAAILVEEKLMTVEQCNTILKKQKRELIDESTAPVDAGELLEPSETQASVFLTDADAPLPAEIETESGLKLTIAGDQLEAVVTIPAGYPAAVAIEEIKNLLVEKGVVFGVVDDADMKEKLPVDSLDEREIVVAKGKSVVLGKNAELIVHFQREYLNPGKVTKDGIIDFRDRGAVPFSAKGDILAEIVPEKEGQNGTDIFGKIIPAPLVEGTAATAGKGTALSEDGLKILAIEDGQPSMTVSGEVSVLQEFTVAGDVDYNTGNILFDGHITVKGAIREGFSVSGGSLTVKEIDGGNIDLKGNLEVSGGILNSKIRIEGNLQAMYMADSSVISYGDVIIKKEIIDSTILTSGSCVSEGTKIITSTISAMKGVLAAEVGTDVSEKCVLKVGVNAHAENEINAVKEILEQKIELLTQTQAALSELEKEQTKYQELIFETAQVQEQSEIKLKQLVAQLEDGREDSEKTDLKSEIVKLEMIIRDAERTLPGQFDSQDAVMNKALQVREECESIILEIEKHNLAIREIWQWAKKQKKDPVVKALKNIYQGTLIIGPDTTLTVKDTCRNSSIKEIEGDALKGEPKYVMKIIPN